MTFYLDTDTERAIVVQVLNDLCRGLYPPLIPEESLREVLGYERAACLSTVEAVLAQPRDQAIALPDGSVPLVVAAIRCRLEGPYGYDSGLFHTTYGAWPDEARSLVCRLLGEPEALHPVVLDRAAVRSLVRDVAMIGGNVGRFLDRAPDDETAGVWLVGFLRDLDVAGRLLRVGETLEAALDEEPLPGGAREWGEPV